MAYPIESSRLLARILNCVSPVARTSNVCPPLTRRFRNGNCSGSDSVRRGVSACACFAPVSLVSLKSAAADKEDAHHMVYADDGFVHHGGHCVRGV